MLLQEQGKLKEAIEVIDGELGKAIHREDERSLMKAELLV